MKTDHFIILLLLLPLSLFSWTWPISRSTTTPDNFCSPFGPRNLNSIGGFTYNYHRGVDIVANVGTEVYSAHPGLVTQYPDSDGNGNWIFLKYTNTSNPERRTYYMHLDSFSTSNNATVIENYEIAESGDSGGVDQHLHLAYVEYDNNTQNYRHPLSPATFPYTNTDVIDVEDITLNSHDFNFVLKVGDTLFDCVKLGITGYGSDGRSCVFSLTIDYNYALNVPGNDDNGVLHNIDDGSYEYNSEYCIELTPEYYDVNNDTYHEIMFEISQEYDVGLDNPNISSITLIVTDAGGNWDFTNILTESIPCHYSLSNSLESNYPNPFNPSTSISYRLSDKISNPRIEVYNTLGQKVKNFLLKETSGENSIVWNGRDENDKQVSSGVYFYRLVNEGKTVQTKKMLLMK